MLELAIHTESQHLQAVLAGRGGVLRRVGDAWRSVNPPADGLIGPWIEFVPHESGVRVRCSQDVNLDLPGRISDKTTLALPLRFSIANTHFELVDPTAAYVFEAASFASLKSGDQTNGSTAPSDADYTSPSDKTLTRWFDALSTLNEWKVGSTEFFQSAADLVIDPLGFDAAYVLRRTKSPAGWDIVAASLPHPELGIWFHSEQLAPLLQRPDVYYQAEPQEASPDWTLLEGAELAMAPWLDSEGQVVGAIVGYRYLHSENQRQGIRPLEAKLLGLLTNSLTKVQQKYEQLEHCKRRRVLLEQAFTATLAERIEAEPQMLDSSRREVTLLFADLRDSCRLFQGTAGSTQSYGVLSDLMDMLTATVLEHQGVIVDYYGDGLAAMWNAPFEQADHPAIACQAALDMLLNLEPVSNKWASTLGHRLSIGIGLHTGHAMVGNVGTRWKLKYGARGDAVNLASRIEQTTKSIGTPIVVSGAVARHLTPHFQVDRLCRARLAGIDEGTDLFRIGSADEYFDTSLYAEVLSLFEAGMYEEAAFTIRQQGEVVDGPLAFLAEQVNLAIESRPARRRRDVPVEPRDRIISFA